MKLDQAVEVTRQITVAPCAGAWIEIGQQRRRVQLGAGSPPARGRGLKLDQAVEVTGQITSPPARGRGLKSVGAEGGGDRGRRPLRGGVD